MFKQCSNSFVQCTECYLSSLCAPARLHLLHSLPQRPPITVNGLRFPCDTRLTIPSTTCHHQSPLANQTWIKVLGKYFPLSCHGTDLHSPIYSSHPCHWPASSFRGGRVLFTISSQHLAQCLIHSQLWGLFKKFTGK